jgi:hypothetical protein
MENKSGIIFLTDGSNIFPVIHSQSCRARNDYLLITENNFSITKEFGFIKQDLRVGSALHSRELHTAQNAQHSTVGLGQYIEISIK